MDLKGKVAVVTGSSSGIGEAIAVTLAKEGTTIIVNSRKNVEGGKKVVESILKEGGESFYIQANLSDEKSTVKLFEEALQKYQNIDFLVNNAGESHGGDFGDLSVWKYQFENILLSQVNATNQFLKIKKEPDLGKILNISSIYGAGLGSDFKHTAYGAMKAAVNSMTVDLARKYSPRILINAVAPGYTWTPPWGTNRSEEELPLKDATKIGRFVESEEIAQMVVAILKNDAITGQIITVDGGATLKDLY